jgi:hypothetical protein
LECEASFLYARYICILKRIVTGKQNQHGKTGKQKQHKTKTKPVYYVEVMYSVKDDVLSINFLDNLETFKSIQTKYESDTNVNVKWVCLKLTHMDLSRDSLVKLTDSFHDDNIRQLSCNDTKWITILADRHFCRYAPINNNTNMTLDEFTALHRQITRELRKLSKQTTAENKDGPPQDSSF